MNKEELLINHVVFILDASGSMSSLSEDLIKVVDNQIQHLAEISKQTNQDVRVSIYTFDDYVQNLVFDRDVLRLPSIRHLYKVRGSTALVDATILGIEDLKLTCQKYGSHSYLLFCLTDGYENASKNPSNKLYDTIKNLPDNWTVAAFVPNQAGKFSAEKYGFPKANISVWSTDSQGMNDVGNVMTKATTSYMQVRSTGVRSVKDLFSVKTENLKATVVKGKLAKLSKSEFSLIPNGAIVREIKQVIEGGGKAYSKERSYYQLTKIEHIQGYKKICLQDKADNSVYTGQSARDLLGLPDHEVKVSPVQHDKYNIFVQSTAPNRKIMPNTSVLVLN